MIRNKYFKINDIRDYLGSKSTNHYRTILCDVIGLPWGENNTSGSTMKNPKGKLFEPDSMFLPQK